MIRVIMGKKGSGKTKQMIEMINNAVQTEHGNVICIEKGNKLTFDIHYQIRLVESSQYDIANYTALKGFISGLYAGNYDITHIFIDSLTKIVGGECDNQTEQFLDWLNNFGEQHNIKFTITISGDASLAPEGVKKYFYSLQLTGPIGARPPPGGRAVFVCGKSPLSWSLGPRNISGAG